VTRKPGAELSPQQEKAIYRYMINGYRKGEALRYAQYAEATCHNPSMIFEAPTFAKELAKRMARVTKKYDIGVDRVLQEIAAVAYGNMADYMTLDPKTGEYLVDMKHTTYEELSALGEFTIETYMEGRGSEAVKVKKARVKPHNKVAALDMLMRHAGAYKDALSNVGEGDVVALLMKAKHRVGEKKDETTQGE